MDLIVINILHANDMILMVNGVYRHFQQYFSYVVAVSFIGGGNRSTQRIYDIQCYFHCDI